MCPRTLNLCSFCFTKKLSAEQKISSWCRKSQQQEIAQRTLQRVRISAWARSTSLALHKRGATHWIRTLASFANQMSDSVKTKSHWKTIIHLQSKLLWFNRERDRVAKYERETYSIIYVRTASTKNDPRGSDQERSKMKF